MFNFTVLDHYTTLTFLVALLSMLEVAMNQTVALVILT